MICQRFYIYCSVAKICCGCKYGVAPAIINSLQPADSAQSILPGIEYF